ncbi:hypothetical protein H8S53_16655 [Bacteroides sp. NSJ-21]|jgi:hypothetical protein|uniref:Uncharacterized protein n=1 Tax=Bacteroides parvus TaxID=2763025 RepID=A0ABR7C5G1_9BACE|nr:hypothetical protein [Bacteroides parvus]MBC5592836.1 hypothetical protein [Bacteroides parvus]
MTERELKIKFDHIQGIFNRCINHASQVMIDGIASKSLYFDEEQADKLEQQEYVRTADELVQLYIRYSVLNDIQYFYSVSDFFWESGFYESLKSDEKRKYMSFNPLSFDYSRYEQDNTVYDEELPYFSVVIKAVVLERYSEYLRKKKESKVQAEMQLQQEQEELQPIQDKCQEPKIIPHVAETENPFKSILNDRQIALLVDCINEVEIFNALMTFEDLKAILSCKPKVIFRSNNNRLVAFLFSELSNRGLITPNWQSVIARNKLFVTKNIKKDKYLNQGDLATAANYVKGVEHEKDYVTISNYIKQLKKL